MKARHMRAVAKALASVHAAASSAVAHGGEPAALLRDAREHLAELSESAVVSPSQHRKLAKRVQQALTHDVGAILDPHAEGRVRAIAASLGPQNVWVRGRQATIDPLEAGAGADTASALAALSCEIRATGEDTLAENLIAAYALAADDYSLYRVIDLYETLSACERASERVDAGPPRQWIGPWVEPHPRSPALILVVGGVASGKSTLAKALSHKLGAPRVVADRARAAVLHPVAELAGAEAALERAWSVAFDDRVYAALLQRARHVLCAGRSCIIDSCNAQRSYRELAAKLANEVGARLVLCTCAGSPERIRARLDARDARDAVRPGDWSRIAQRLEANFEAVSGDEPGLHLRITTDESPAACASAVADSLAAPHVAPPFIGRNRGWPAAVTFDCWNTLLEEKDWELAHGLRVDALLAAVHEDGFELDRAVVSAAFDAAWARHMEAWRAGVVSGAREVARWSLERLHLPLPDHVVDHLSERFQTASHSASVLGLPGARETLAALREAGVPMALVCDTGLTPGRIVRRHLDRVGLLEPLSAEIFSDEVGVPKPDRRIFEAALRPLGVAPERAVHVGDLLRTDIHGAREMGMGSVRLTAASDDADDRPEADAVVDSHEALLALLGSWSSRG